MSGRSPPAGAAVGRRRLGNSKTAGTVIETGAKVTGLRPGDEVFGGTASVFAGGAFAEYGCVPRDKVVSKPAMLTFEQAAAVPIAAITALRALRNAARVRPGQQVLINGASGGVGTFAVQIAKALGAQVTGVCSTRNTGLVVSIGADKVIDYTREDFTRDLGEPMHVQQFAKHPRWPARHIRPRPPPPPHPQRRTANCVSGYPQALRPRAMIPPGPAISRARI